MFNTNKIASRFVAFYSKRTFFLLLFLLVSIVSNAQCAMCRAALESEEGGSKGAAVNDGIVYLMAFPYLLVGIVGYVVYKLFKKQKQTN
jgi:uncharacterized membrane protein